MRVGNVLKQRYFFLEGALFTEFWLFTVRDGLLVKGWQLRRTVVGQLKVSGEGLVEVKVSLLGHIRCFGADLLRYNWGSHRHTTHSLRLHDFLSVKITQIALFLLLRLVKESLLLFLTLGYLFVALLLIKTNLFGLFLLMVDFRDRIVGGYVTVDQTEGGI